MKCHPRILLAGLLICALATVGCSSKKKKGAGDEEGAYPKDDITEEGLVLNGDSDSGKAGALRTIYFAYDSAVLAETAKDVLTKNAQYLKTNSSIKIQVEGHADERGGVQYNLALGQKRAQTVKNYLKAMGIDGPRISIVSYGKERPIEFGHDESAWSKNRRANFVVTQK